MRMLLLLITTLSFSYQIAEGQSANGLSKVDCINWEVFQNSAAVEVEARNILEQFANGETAEIWQAADVVFKNTVSENALLEFSLSSAQMMKNVAVAKLSRADVLKLQATAKQTGFVSCKNVLPGNAEYIQARIWQGITEIVPLIFILNDDIIDRKIVVVFAKRSNEHYKLINLYIGLNAYFQKDAEYFSELSDRELKLSNSKSALWFLEFARQLSGTGNIVYYDAFLGTMKKIHDARQISKSNETIKLNNSEIELLSLSFIELENKIVPRISYVSNEEKSTDNSHLNKAVEAESQQIYEEIKLTYNSVFNEFEGVMFQAYFEKPIDSNKQYAFYKFLIEF